MKLSEHQAIFTYNIAALILYANSRGIALTRGEGYRTRSQQLLYFYGYKVVRKNGKIQLVKDKKRSKTMNSNHLRRLADDFNHFIDGKLVSDRETLQVLGDYWCSLHPKNRWGGNWGWDVPHYEMNV